MTEVDARSAAVESGAADRGRGRDRLEWVIPFFTAIGLLGVLVVASTPGWWFPLAFAAVGVLAVGFVMWAVRVVVEAAATVFLSRNADGRPEPVTPSSVLAVLIVVPVAVVATGCVVAADVPLEVRWHFSQPAFDEAVRSGLVVAPYQAPGLRIETYEIRSVERVGGDVLFTDANGGFFDDAGFAHLPDGPDDGQSLAFGLESPVFHELGDDWYWWTATW